MFYLVCVQPFHHYTKGQIITDQAEIAKLLVEREQHFVKVAAPKA